MKLEQVSEELIYFIEKYPKIINWSSLFEIYLFSEEYILDNFDKIFSSFDNDRLDVYLSTQIITDNILIKFNENNIILNTKADFLDISLNPNLTIDFITKHCELITWTRLFNAPRNISIIDKYEKYVDWYQHSTFVLPEVFEKYKDKINIIRYCMHNEYISKEIIIKYFDELDINCLLKNVSCYKEIKDYIRMFV